MKALTASTSFTMLRMLLETSSNMNTILRVRTTFRKMKRSE